VVTENAIADGYRSPVGARRSCRSRPVRRAVDAPNAAALVGFGLKPMVD
jgi:hypothetical protein